MTYHGKQLFLQKMDSTVNRVLAFHSAQGGGINLLFWPVKESITSYQGEKGGGG